MANVSITITSETVSVKEVEIPWENSHLTINKACTDKEKISLIQSWLKVALNYAYFYIDENYMINEKNGTALYIDWESKSLPDYIQFNDVKGEFILRGGTYETLKGCPFRVGGRFSCRGNKLTSLKYSPLIIGYNRKKGEYCNFNCSDNNLESLIGISFVEHGDIFCYNNNIKSFDGIQEIVNGDLIASKNHINTFVGMPKYIKGVFDVSNNDLDDSAWEYAKENIDGEFGDYRIKGNKFIKYNKELY